MHRGRQQQLRKRHKVLGRRSSFYQVSIGAWFIVRPCSHVPCGVRLSAADVAWVLLRTLAAAGTVLGVDCSLSVYSCFAMLRLAVLCYALLCYAMACYAVGSDLHMAFGAASIGREDVVHSPLVYQPVVRS